ncbi:uncharacterized protein UTRI_02135_B [Ustilago trichophora]|uniref:Uncharacterized protein n=1 Tax=Ustilago trichophora TaxID=86804 RepID=A0A5C3DWU6_9BASI|nr:uncharacterized protein UTRI_02135_B [Ustilago trichophora]
MASIDPPDKSNRLHSWILLGAVGSTLALLPVTFVYEHFAWLLTTAVFPCLTFLLLAYRQVTPERASAMRLTLDSADYRSYVRFRHVTPSQNVREYGKGLVFALIFANLPIPQRTFLDKVLSGMGSVLATIQVLQAVTYCVFIAFEGLLAAFNEEKEGGELIRLQDLEVSGEEWVRTGSSWRRDQETWVRRIRGLKKAGLSEKTGEEDRETWELKVVPAPKHKDAKLEAKDTAIVQVLTIVL